MKRYNVIKLFSSYLKENDLAIFAGTNIGKEAYLNDREGNFYIEDETGVGISLALGIALNTDKRVFLFCDDYYFIKDLSAVLHVSLSKRTNLFLVVLNSGEYQYSGHNPTIFRSIIAFKGLMFNAGFLVNDYTRHFSNVQSSKGAKNLLENLHGPVFIVIDIDLGENKNIDKIDLTTEEKLERLTSFLSKEGTSLVVYDSFDFYSGGGAT